MKRLAIIGSGDLGQQIAYQADNTGLYSNVGFFDDFEKTGTTKHGLPVLGGVEEIANTFAKGIFDELIMGIGYKHTVQRAAIFERFVDFVPFATIVHPASYIDKSVRLGKGVLIYPGCTLDMNVTIGDNVLINVGCVIAHDTTIHKHSFLSPGVTVAGFVQIGENVNLGIGTIVIDNITIAKNIRTGGGTTVIDNLAEPGLYVGVPAMLKKPAI